MTLQEAIAKSTPEMWFRPVSWKGTNQAFCIQNGFTVLVPTSKGGSFHMTFSVDELVGEWELIPMVEVNAEK